MTAGSKQPSTRGGVSRYCSFCSDENIARRVGDLRLCAFHDSLMQADDSASERARRRQKYANLIPPSPQI